MSCPDCFKGFSLAGETVGIISTDGAYFSPAPEGSDSKRAVFLLTDIFGLPLNNPKVMADQFAKDLGCDVWVPDMFAGRPPVKSEQMKLPDVAGQKMSLLNKIGLIFTILTSLPGLIRNRPSVCEKRVIELYKKVQAEKKYEAIGAVGYCFGGTIGIMLGATDMFKSIAIFHPGRFSFDQLNAIKVPSSWGFAEEDMNVSPDKRARIAADLTVKKEKDASLECEFFDYKGTTHGYAARPNLAHPEVKAGFEGSMMQTIAWFKKTLVL